MEWTVENIVRSVQLSRGHTLTAKGVSCRPAGNDALRRLSVRVQGLTPFSLFPDGVEYESVTAGLVAGLSQKTGRGIRSVLAALQATLCPDALPDGEELHHSLLLTDSVLLLDKVARAGPNVLTIDFVETALPMILMQFEQSWDFLFSGPIFTRTNTNKPKMHALLRHFRKCLLRIGAATEWSMDAIERAHREWAKRTWITNGRDADHLQQAKRAIEAFYVEALFPLLFGETPTPYGPPAPGPPTIMGALAAASEALVKDAVAEHLGVDAEVIVSVRSQLRRTLAGVFDVVQRSPTYAGDVVLYGVSSGGGGGGAAEPATGHMRVVGFAALAGGAIFVVGRRLVGAGESRRANFLRVRNGDGFVVVECERVGRKVRDTPFESARGGGGGGGGGGELSFLVSKGVLP